ncbi:MAG: hypothetical protein KAJ63_04945, partial [Methyloprofundus sp.]|nr:hypothetical protein [Methyloprofundus sp.]
LGSNWFWASWPLLAAGLVFIFGSLIWWVFFRSTKKIIAIAGGDRFERVMIGRKPKGARKKAAAKKPVKPRAKAESKPTEPAVKPANTETSATTDKTATEQIKTDNSQDNKGA